MLKSLSNKIGSECDHLIAELTAYNFFTNKLGLARSILAFSLLLTLVFNSPHTLFPDMDNNFLHLHGLSFNFFLLFGAKSLGLSKSVAILILLVIIMGYYPQATCILHAWLSLSFSNLCVVAEGGDQLISNISILLIPICLLDNRKNHWLSSQPHVDNLSRLISNFFLELIRIQVSVVYFMSATAKFSIREWRDGTAVYYWLHDPVFGLPGYLQALGVDNIITHGTVGLLTWGALIIEIVLFMGLLTKRRYRKPLMLLGIGFHFLIFLFMGLFSFFISMTGALIFYLADLRKDIFENQAVGLLVPTGQLKPVKNKVP